MVTTFAQIVFGGARLWPWRTGKGVVLAVHLRAHAAVITHLDQAQLIFVEHGVPGQPLSDLVDGGFYAE